MHGTVRVLKRPPGAPTTRVIDVSVLNGDSAPRPAPPADKPLDLVVRGGWRLPVLCTGPSDGDELRLEPVSGAAAMPGAIQRCAATLEWCCVHGLVQRDGTLALRDGAFALSELGEAVVTQRRSFMRVPVAVRVAVARRGDEGLLSRSVDLSIGGMLIQDAEELRVGQRVRFTIAIPGERDVNGSGEVVRAAPYGHRGLRFDPLPYADDQRLSRFVFALAREERATAGRG